MTDSSSSTAGEASYGISELSRAVGITSRTLRHYDHLGIFSPAYVSESGYRYYSGQQIPRLQRILLLRQFGLRLDAIKDVLDAKQDEAEALREHMHQLERQRTTIDKQLNAVSNTLRALEKGEAMDLESSFEGFNEQYKEEVTERWGEQAYKQSDRWWKTKSEEERNDFMQIVKKLNSDWIAAGKSGADATSDLAQRIAERHVSWLGSIPGTPAAQGDRAMLRQYVLGLSDMYVADERFAKNYQGHEAFVRDALQHYVSEHLGDA